VNAITLLTAALGGVFLIGFLILGMNYNHPYASESRFYFTTTPILPTVSGKVVEVPVQANTPIKAGDKLFRIEDTPYRAAVTEKKAALAEAEQNVKELGAALSGANRLITVRKSDRDRAKDTFDRGAKLKAGGSASVISAADLEQLRGEYLAAEANVGVAEAEAERARLNAESMIGGINTEVARLQAELQTPSSTFRKQWFAPQPMGWCCSSFYGRE
jgi:multidrug resistance efflux pump